MDYVIISDGLSYKIAQLIESHKNNHIVKLANNLKKVKQNQLIYPIEPKNVAQIDKINLIEIQIDTQLLYELMDDESRLTIHELALLYFGEQVTPLEMTSLLFTLAAEETLFHNYQDGSFRKCSIEEQMLRKKIAEKQQYQLEQFTHYHDLFLKAFTDGTLITQLDIDIFKLLHKPDKHAPAYKALQHITHKLKLTPLDFCHKIGLVPDLPQFFLQCFMSDNLPRENNSNYEIIATDLNAFTQRLDLQIFSIDDVTTTEIDDAFSVEYKEGGYTVGIHIAAPALNSSVAQIVADNLSTVYYPGNKLTMLPESIIQQYSLTEAKILPVVSIYFDIDNEFNIVNYTSVVNVVKITANLRIEELEKLFNYDNLEFDNGYTFENELKLLYQFALKLEETRGRVSAPTIIRDYNIGFDDDKIYIRPRMRGHPLDKVVSELMILANCSWGRLLTNSFIPAIYRVKQFNYPVKSTLAPESHCGLNVDYYTWLTSPLRRATDYINQQQLIGLLNQKNGGYNAVDPLLLYVIENFDAKYAKYLDFQNKMEKYWSLKYLIQEQINEVNAIFLNKTTVQLEGVPIELDLNNITSAKPRGAQIKLKIYNINLANLSFEFKLLDNPI